MNDEEELETGLDVLRDTVGDMAEEDDESGGGPLTAAVEQSLAGAAPTRVERPVREMLMRELEETRRRLTKPREVPSSPLDRLIERFSVPTGKSGSLLVARRERDIERAKEDEERRADLLTLLSKQEQLESADINEQDRIAAARAKAAQPPRTGTGEFERLTSALQSDIPEEQKKLIRRRIRMLTEGSLPRETTDALAKDYEIISNPDKYPPNVVAAAQARIEKFTPRDIREEKRISQAKDNLYRSRISRQVRVVIPDIDRAIKILDKNPNISAGNFSNWIVDLPVFGQQAKDLDSLLQSVRSAVGFGQLEDLKLMSPTGASGLGAVSNFEQQLLQSVEGSLARDMSAPNLKMNLERLKNFYEVDLPMFIEAQGVDLSGIGGRPASPSGEGEESPAEKARKELERRRSSQQGGG
jgi:hypothetical protein